jgi:hypothetical protein
LITCRKSCSSLIARPFAAVRVVVPESRTPRNSISEEFVDYRDVPPPSTASVSGPVGGMRRAKSSS